MTEVCLDDSYLSTINGVRHNRSVDEHHTKIYLSLKSIYFTLTVRGIMSFGRNVFQHTLALFNNYDIPSNET